MFGIILLLISTVIGLTIGSTHLYNENEKLRQIEWLYRSERILYRTDEEQKVLLNKEKDFLKGTWQEQDSIKDSIRYFETHRQLDKAYIYFDPTKE